MRYFVVFVACHLAWLGAADAATQPLYINSSPVNVVARPQMAPVIDATAFLNQSEFEINDIYFSGLPYQTYNTRFFTNAASGVMLGDMGYRFEYANGNTRAPLDWFVNRGSISGNTFLLVSASSIISSGPLGTSEGGLLRLTGNSINLNRNSVRAGGGMGFSSSGFMFSETNYFDPSGVTDNYWGIGTNSLRVDGANFDPASFSVGSPGHGVTTAPFGSSNNVRIPSFYAGAQFTSSQFFSGNVSAYSFREQLSANSQIIHVVFLPTTNFFDSNISTRVYWQPDFTGGGGLSTVVEFGYPETDIINQSVTTNYFTLTDTSTSNTNIVMARNQAANTRRPNSFELTRANYISQFGTTYTTNLTYTPALLYNGSYASNSVSAGYSAFSATASPITVLNGSGQNVYLTTDPTNYPGRIEINGDSLSLDATRIRAEATISIKTRDLSSNKVARIDAPFANFDLRTLQPQMVISNFAPKSVQRLGGQISAWSATWRNTENAPSGTNSILFHVLMVDHNLNANQAVVINELALHAPHLVIGDQLAVRKTIQIDARSLDVTGGLTLPASASWGNGNMVELYNLTNRGFINVSANALVGTDRPNRYDNYINAGTNVAASQQIRTRNLQNSGCLRASSGLMTIEADTLAIKGAPLTTNVALVGFTNVAGGIFVFVYQTNVTGAKLQANSDIQITANSMTVSNSSIQTGPVGSALILNVRDNLADAGGIAPSEWQVSGGFQLLSRPTSGNLLGTRLRSTIGRNGAANHTWAGEDRGATAAGFSNNVALGKLTLDGDTNSLFEFAPSAPGTRGAIYVDYLELLNQATNINTQLSIDPNLTIYFANANISAVKLNGSAGGRLRWVSSFTGPNSSTNITYTTTNSDGSITENTYTLNTALATDKNIDSDGDGVVNGDDPTPVYTTESVGLRLSTTKAKPPQVLVRWNGLRFATNTVEYKSALTNATWTVLTNIVPPGPFSGPLSVADPFASASSNGVQRFYRVRVNVPLP